MTAAELALRQGRAILFLAIAAAGAGLAVAATVPKGVYPEIVYEREQVVASLPGASVAAVQAGLTRRLEEELASVPGLATLRSRTIRGGVELSLYFVSGTDMDQAHALTLARVAEARQALPPEAEVTAERVLPSNFPILSINVEGPYPASQLYELTQYTVRPALAGLPGVGQVVVQSSDVPEVQVLLEPARLESAHLTVSQVASRLREANGVQTVSRLEQAHELVLGLVSGELRSVEEIGAVVVAGTAEQPVRLRDLGRIEESVAPRTTLIRVDGKPGVILNVTRRIGGDILELDQAVAKALAEVQGSLPPGVRFVPVYQQATFVEAAVKGVRDAVLFGALFAILVLALFLRDWRATLLAALSLPLTLAESLLVLKGFGQTLNLMTLGGLAISVGLVIDDAVVIIEAVHKHLEAGLPPREAARRGTEELFWPVIGTTATTVVVFLPLGLLGGVVGQFFVALSLSLASAVVLSLPMALAVLPSLAAGFLRPVRRASAGQGIVSGYARALAWSLDRRWLAPSLALFLVAGGVVAFLNVPTDFLPEADEGSYVVDYFAPVGASLEEVDALAAQIEDVLRTTPEVASFSRRLGTELGPATATLPSRGDIAVSLTPKRSRGGAEIMEEQRGRIAALVPGLRVEFIQVLADLLGDLEGAPQPVEVKLFGPDPEVLRTLAREASRRIRDVEGLVDFFDGDEGCTPELQLRVDALQAGRQGLSASEVARQLAGSSLGEVATQLRRPDHLEGVRVRASLEAGAAPAASFQQSAVLNPAGARVPALSLGQLERSCPTAQLLRENQRNLVHVTARLSRTSLGDALKAIRARLEGWELPVGYSWTLGGLYGQQRESFRALLEALAVALIAVTAVLLFQLRSARLAAAILAATPVALAAGMIVLTVAGISLNVSSMMGAIVLVGLVVKNGILLLDFAVLRAAEGLAPREAVLEAARSRLRPILMTTLATLVALIPLVLGLGEGSALHQPLAVLVVGGLAFSTAATLFLVPALSLGALRRFGPGRG
ncbi:MAG TPA: efflux RND transporter permease subunit [Myxococcales bacterium]